MIPSLFVGELARQRQAELLAMAAARPPRVRTARPWAGLRDLAAGVLAAIRADAEAVHLGPLDNSCLPC
jgi:hypothetical protein